MERFDFELDDTFDLAMDGDLSVGPSDSQHIQLIAQSSPLNWKATPQLGIDAIKYVNGPENKKADFTKAVKTNLIMDGYKNIQVDLSAGIKDFKVSAEDAI